MPHDQTLPPAPATFSTMKNGISFFYYEILFLHLFSFVCLYGNCACICICVCIHGSLMYLCVHVYIHICMSICSYVYSCVPIRACIDMCLWLCIYSCVYMYMCVCAYVVNLCICVCTYICLCMHTCVDIYVYMGGSLLRIFHLHSLAVIQTKMLSATVMLMVLIILPRPFNRTRRKDWLV